MRAYTFEEVLADKEGRKIIEGIEHIDKNNKDLVDVRKSLINDLKEKFNYKYRE